MEPATLPKHIDDPVTWLIWSGDAFAPAAQRMGRLPQEVLARAKRARFAPRVGRSGANSKAGQS